MHWAQQVTVRIKSSDRLSKTVNYASTAEGTVNGLRIEKKEQHKQKKGWQNCPVGSKNRRNKNSEQYDPVGSSPGRCAVEVKFQYETDETCRKILRCYWAFAATLPTLPSCTESWCLRNKWHWFAVGTSKVRSLADALSHSGRMHLIIFMSNWTKILPYSVLHLRQLSKPLKTLRSTACSSKDWSLPHPTQWMPLHPPAWWVVGVLLIVGLVLLLVQVIQYQYYKFYQQGIYKGMFLASLNRSRWKWWNLRRAAMICPSTYVEPRESPLAPRQDFHLRVQLGSHPWASGRSFLSIEAVSFSVFQGWCNAQGCVFSKPSHHGQANTVTKVDTLTTIWQANKKLWMLTSLPNSPRRRSLLLSSL